MLFNDKLSTAPWVETRQYVNYLWYCKSNSELG